MYVVLVGRCQKRLTTPSLTEEGGNARPSASEFCLPIALADAWLLNEYLITYRDMKNDICLRNLKANIAIYRDRYLPVHAIFVPDCAESVRYIAIDLPSIAREKSAMYRKMIFA